MEINTDKIAEDCIKAINEKIKNLKIGMMILNYSVKFYYIL